MKNILIVEDEAINRLALSTTLKRKNFNVLEAGTSKEALSIVKANDIDIILMDINLPDGNGLDIAKKIKVNKNISIIVLSGLRKEECFEEYIDAYLSKPIVINNLLKIINHFIEEKEMNGEYYT